MSTTPNKFDAVCVAIEPIIFKNVPPGTSVGDVREMIEDIAYLITHGYPLRKAAVRIQYEMKNAFKQGQKVRIKKTPAAKKLLASVWLAPKDIDMNLAGRIVYIDRLDDYRMGRPSVMCHSVSSAKLPGGSFWVPPGALEAV